MPQLDLKPRAKKFIESLPQKQKKQIKDYILSLQENPYPQDARALKGYDYYIRADVGEYRIIYKYDKVADLLVVVLVGKRNDDEIYRMARRVLK